MTEENKGRFTITLTVYNETIQVTIDREDEFYYREAAKYVTERYNTYAGRFNGQKSDHRIALMTLLDIALSYQRERAKNDTELYDNILSRLTSEIEETLK